jgi:hypothetical protein
MLGCCCEIANAEAIFCLRINIINAANNTADIPIIYTRSLL